MPAPKFEWRTYEIRVPADSPLRALTLTPSPFALRRAAPDTMTIRLPDLAAWPSPLDKAEILLESAAEIEHALMVQYLYAAYSLKSNDEVIDPAQQAALDDLAWPAVLFGIAREEMGHLMTVQNMLLLLGLPPNFEREGFPPRKELYPFSLHLERLSQKSLAKYVVTEAPFGAPRTSMTSSSSRKSRLARRSTTWVFSTACSEWFSLQRSRCKRGALGAREWDAMVRHLSEAAYQQAPADAWHLPDNAFHPLSGGAASRSGGLADRQPARPPHDGSRRRAIRHPRHRRTGGGPYERGRAVTLRSIPGYIPGSGRACRRFPPPGNGAPRATSRQTRRWA